MAIGIRFKKTSVDQTETGMGTLIKLNSGGPGQLSIGVLKQIRDRCIEAETNAKESEEIASNAAISAAASADSALESKNISTSAASAAAQSESNAAISAGSASDNALASASSAYQASNSAQQSADSATAAEASKVAAKASEDAAAASALAAANSAEAARLSKLSAADSEANALNYKNDAYNSKLDAEEAARQAKFLVEGGTVDGGAWDASTGIYPDKPFVLDDQGQPLYVSGFWKVSGNGTVEGIDYSINDTLRYSASLDEFYKIDSTESVSSVNSKKGAVVLTYEDVGAVASTDGNILGSLKFSQNGLGTPLGIYFGQTLNRSDRALYGDALSVQIGSTDKQLQLFGLNDLKFNGQKVFHEGFYPTPDQVNAVSKSGDSMTGPLNMESKSVVIVNGINNDAAYIANASDGSKAVFRLGGSELATMVGNYDQTGSLRYLLVGEDGIKFGEDNKLHTVLHSGNIQEVTQAETYDLRHLDSELYYPMAFISPYPVDFFIDNWTGSAALEYNNNILEGTLRTSGWSDRYPVYDIMFRAYTKLENTIHSVWRGTTDFYGFVVYIRGGNILHLRSSVKPTIYETDATIGSALFKAGITDPNASGNVSAAALIGSFVGKDNIRLSNMYWDSVVLNKDNNTRFTKLNNFGTLDFWDSSTSNASGIRIMKESSPSDTVIGFGTHWNGLNNTIFSAFSVGVGDTWYNGDLLKLTLDGKLAIQRLNLTEGFIYTDKTYIGILSNEGAARNLAAGGLTTSNNYAHVSSTPAQGIYSIGNIRTAQHLYSTNAEIYQGSWGHASQGFIDIQNTSTSWAYNVWSLNGGAGIRMQALGGSNASGAAARLILNDDKYYNFTTNYLTIPGYISMNAGHLYIPDGAVFGNYGSISINGAKGGYAGIHFGSASRTLMVGSSVQGFHTGSAWQWYFENGVLNAGSVPYARTTGVAAASHTHTGHDVKILGNYLVVNSNGTIAASDINQRQAGMYGIYESTKVGHIWSMGTAYKIAANGAGFGNLYGAAYAYQTVGNYAGGHQFLWCQNGTVYVGLGEYIWARNNIFAYSDIRVKKNIRIIDNALDRIRRSNGCFFNRTDGDDPNKVHVGVIAQNMLETLPEVVGGGPTDKDPDSKYSVAYGNITALLIEGIKEQDSIVQAQEEVIETLRSEVANLTGRLDKLETLLTKILGDK